MEIVVASFSTLVVAVLYLLFDNYSYKKKINERLSPRLFKENNYKGPVITPIQHYDNYKEKQNLKKKMSKLEYPTVKEYTKRVLLNILLFIVYQQFHGGGLIQHLEKSLLTIALIIVFYIVIYYLWALPKYINTFEKHLSHNIKLLSYDIDSSENLQKALVMSKSYGHPEFVKVCENIAHLTKIGFNLEQAIKRILPDVKSEKLAMFLAILIISSNSGGKLSKVLRDISDLFESENKLQVNISSSTNLSRFGLFVSILYLPLLMIFIDYKFKSFSRVFIDSEKGFRIFLLLVIIYLLGNSVMIYLLKREKL